MTLHAHSKCRPETEQYLCLFYLCRLHNCLKSSQPHTVDRQMHLVPYHIAEDEAGVGEFEVFEQAVEFAAVQGTPGTVKIISCLCLLPRVIIIQELKKDRSHRLQVKPEKANLQQM